MLINTKTQEELLSKFIKEEKSVSGRTALQKVKDMVGNAKNTAFSFAPAPTFTYTDTMPTDLANAITGKQRNQLAAVGITFQNRFGWSTQIKMIFQT